MILTKRTLLAAALAVASTRAMAQSWPAKPIRMIVPLAPGATADIVARLFADELGKALGQTIVVDNKTGAGGTIATAELARAPADGYTMGLVSQGTMVFNIGLYKTPGYDPLKDLAMVAVSGGVSNVLIVSPDNPAKTVADLLAQARAKPGELTYSSGGVGTSHHMSGVLLELRTGVKLQHVPYRATPAGIQAVANGEVAMGLFNTPTVIGLIKGGKLKALAVTSEQRSDPPARRADDDRGRGQGIRREHLDGLRGPGRRARAGDHASQCRDQPHRPVAAGAREDDGARASKCCRRARRQRRRSWFATTSQFGSPSSRPRARRRIRRQPSAHSCQSGVLRVSPPVLQSGVRAR